jgi:Ca-activated chloride channel family protein
VIEIVPNLAVKYHRVQVHIEDQVAQTEIDQVFVNESPYDLEGTYIFPLPEEASISDFGMYVDQKRLSGKILGKDEARRVYESIVNRRRDPALLEYVGRNAFQASIYPIQAHGEKRVQLSYSQILPAVAGLVHYVYPLNTERFSSRALEEVAINVELRSRVPIRAIYSPSHKISVERTSDTSASISFEANGVKPDKDFELYYSISADDVGLNVLSYKERDEDGFFLFLVSPKLKVDLQAVIAKDVVLVLDVSGSMEGEKLQQAQAALSFVLDHLNAEDRFNIVAFDTAVRMYAPTLQPASQREEARRFVRALSGGGSTNIDRALLEALALSKGDRPQFIIFLTDGLPTAGETDLNRIIADVDRAATPDVRLFSFGVGYDVNTVLLDSISQNHRGASAYVVPGQSIEAEVSAFYSKISTPLLSDVRLTADGVVLEDMYPYPLPDLFAGGELLVAGRYRKGGITEIKLQGVVNGEARSFSYASVRFSDQGGQSFVPRLWATRKIGYMLQEIRLKGDNKELVDSIVALSVRYGIMTPYTSFLVDERQDILTYEGRQRIAAESSLAAATAAPAMGAQAVADSRAQTKLSITAGNDEESQTGIQVVENKTFILRSGVWIDTTYDPQKMRPIHVQFGSPDYFTLVAEDARWGKYLSLGERVLVALDGKVCQIEPGSVERAPELSPTPQATSPWEQFWAWFRVMTH